MTKRLATDLSGGLQSSPSKRRRTSKFPADEKPEFIQGSSKSPKIAEDEDDDGGEESANSDIEIIDESGFEEQHGDTIRESVQNRRRLQGAVAEHGIIETVRMKNFMCHDKLHFEFGPQINFIIGHNGSGKSAVLSAITIALGGKSSFTGRGRGLREFVKEGQHQATIELTLKNGGDEAFKPEQYGKTILIIRKFDTKGASSWKICSANGTVVSDKRKELNAICDHMNLQVDNPMSVLTQDAARQFLSASNPHDMYRLFSRGTLLLQLEEEYTACDRLIKQTQRTLTQKRELLPELEEKCARAKETYEEAKQTEEQVQRMTTLRQELAWSHVAVKKGEFAERVQQVTKQEAHIEKLQAKIVDETSKVEAATLEVERREAACESLGNMDNLNDEKRRLAAAKSSKKAEIADLNLEAKEISNEKRAVDAIIKDCEERITQENRKMVEVNSEHRQRITDRLEAAKAAQTDAEKRAVDMGQRIVEGLSNASEVESRCKSLEQEVESAKTRAEHLEAAINRSKEVQQDSTRTYGNNIKDVRAKLEEMHWHGTVPLGPLGMHVELKPECQAYADVIRSQLGNRLLSFAITDGRDRAQLKQVLNRSNNSLAAIVIYDPDLFDYSSGEPSKEHLTVLRALEFSNEDVKRILINQKFIERVLLGPTRREVESRLKTMKGEAQGWSADLMRVKVFSEGGGSSTGINRLDSKHRANELFNQRSNMSAKIGQYQNQLQQEVQTRDDAQRRLSEQQHNLRTAMQEVERLRRQERQIRDQCRKASFEVKQIGEQIVSDMPVDLAVLEEKKQEAESSRRSCITQFEALQHKVNELKEDLEQIETQKATVDRQFDDFHKIKAAAMKEVEKALTKRASAQHAQAHYAAKLTEASRQLGNHQQACDVTEQELQEWTEGARTISPQEVADPRSVEVIKHAIKLNEATLQHASTRDRRPAEDLLAEWNERKRELRETNRVLDGMDALMEQLDDSLRLRIERWLEFRRYIALRCKIIFGLNLSHRGYYGKVMFKHDKETLEIKVQTEDMVGSQRAEKDPRTLSGGEKSFSTICLLLSLWESIGSPLRCLDEFDVFMDAVNRRISMRMMIDCASSADKKQYILITPQDMAGIKIGDQVRVHRMDDPVRRTLRG